MTIDSHTCAYLIFICIMLMPVCFFFVYISATFLYYTHYSREGWRCGCGKSTNSWCSPPARFKSHVLVEDGLPPWLNWFG
ncbi:uncharacterized protein VTP21DRAFT_11656 [Calcarisporiella thermophila]|uniref:uncharacterized protein n=1 Tax=Calcarisporiella thermophila TaxID=911321 RepID=UPI003742C888